MKRVHPLLMTGVLVLCMPGAVAAADEGDLRTRAEQAMRRAAVFFREQVAAHGGYVYYYTPDLGRRWGEGEATRDQVWVQRPGTPAVGLAYLEAWGATGDPYYLDAATAAGEALVYGQLESGGWTNCIDFDPKGTRTAQYRNGKGSGTNQSSLDDGQTQGCIVFLSRLDAALDFKHAEIHRAATTAIDALLAAQFPNGAFPQGWRDPLPPQPVRPARYPEYDWRTEGRIKNYWDMYTLNDGNSGYLTEALRTAHEVYGDDRCRDALARLGDFLLLAQMPDPQPAWAQQYNYDMEPIWARKFEPAAISGWESQDVLESLVEIHRITGDAKYLVPVPRALDYLEAVLLPDGRLARYYELQTNRPLYMKRRGDVYELTYDDEDLPDHYGWKFPARLDAIRTAYEAARAGTSGETAPTTPDLEAQIRNIVAALDARGRWIDTYTDQRLPGDQSFKPGDRYIGSDTFAANLHALSAYLRQAAER